MEFILHFRSLELRFLELRFWSCVFLAFPWAPCSKVTSFFSPAPRSCLARWLRPVPGSVPGFSCPTRCVSQDELTHSSFLEVFKYSCNGEVVDNEESVRVACDEHRDTGLLTVIPKGRGRDRGLEGYSWELGQWVPITVGEGEAVVFAGELIPFLHDSVKDLPALTHRVVLPVVPETEGKVYRYSMPFELLPPPSAAVTAQGNALERGLVSVNY